MGTYSKSAYTSEQHVQLLKSRGLAIEVDERVKHYLDVIGYCRLESYFAPFCLPNYQFRQGTTFQNILDIYNFDRKLRLLTSDVIERVEIAVRVSISNIMSIKYGAHWYMNESYFSNLEEHASFIEQVERYTYKNNKSRRSAECHKYYSNYSSPELPPSWVIAEVLPMGVWSRLYANLKDKRDKRAIADVFGFKHTDFVSWLQAMTNIRNIVAHHSRLWNRPTPTLVSNLEKYSYIGASNAKSSYTIFIILKAFTNRFMRNSQWHIRLATLLGECPLPIYNHMGFPSDWQSQTFWS